MESQMNFNAESYSFFTPLRRTVFSRAPPSPHINNLEAEPTIRTFIAATTKVGRMTVPSYFNFSNPHTVSFTIHFNSLPLLICCFWTPCCKVLPNIYNCIHYSSPRDTAPNYFDVHIHRNFLLYIFLSHYYYWRVFYFPESSVKISYPSVLTATNKPFYVSLFTTISIFTFTEIFFSTHFYPIAVTDYVSITWIDF